MKNLVVVLKDKKFMSSLLALIVIVLLSMTFGSCTKDESLNYYEQPKFVEDPPEALAGNKYQAYVTMDDVQTAKLAGMYTINRTEQVYFDEYGNKVIDRNSETLELYKIKARHYWNWDKNIQYASTWREEYEIPGYLVASIKERLKNVSYVICQINYVVNEDDHIGLGQAITSFNY